MQTTYPIYTVERFTRTPTSRSRAGSLSFEGVAESSTTYPRAVVPPPPAMAGDPLEGLAQPLPLRARACRCLRSTSVWAVSVLGGSLLGWASYAVTMQAGASRRTGLAVGVSVGSAAAACFNTGLRHLLDNRQRQRVVALPPPAPARADTPTPAP